MSKPTQDLRRLGTVLLAGAVAGVGLSYVASRRRPAPETTTTGETRLIDWQMVRRIAVKTSQSQAHPVRKRAEMQALYTDMVRRSEPLIAEYLGVALPQPVERIEVVDRAQWLDANISSFREMFGFIEDIYRNYTRPRTVGTQVAASMNQRVASVQVGVLLGILGRKVLGQYDLSLLAPERNQGALYFVEPNIALVQNGLGLDAYDFRLWIALHETTHAYEFEAYPWVRGHFNGLLRRFFDLFSEQLQGLQGGLGAFIARIREQRGTGQHWMEMIQTPKQRELFQELQALMSLVEGYSNHIMNAIGEQVLPNFAVIEKRIEERKGRKSIFDQLFNRITGMDLKLAQYAEGQKFVDTVVGARDIRFANKVWERAENLPSIAEIRQPMSWVARMESA